MPDATPRPPRVPWAAALGRAVRGLALASHPGPTVVVSVLALVLGVSAGLDAGRLVLLTAAVLAGQLSVGWSNDAVDAARDTAVGRADKPVARGDVSRRTVWTAAAVAVVAAIALSAPLGVAMLSVHALTLVSAWGYNVALKRTPFSVVPFVVSFGLFPSLATLSLPEPQLAAPWAWAAGAALGVAVHLTNVLPDLDDDARTGVRGLPHRLGATASSILAFSAVELGALAVLLGPLAGGAAVSPPGVVGFVLVTGVGVAGLVRALRGPDRTVFRLVMLAALLLAAQLAVTGVGI